VPGRQRRVTTAHGLELAQINNAALVASVEARAGKDDAVLAACLRSYQAWLAANRTEHPLRNLTHHLVSTRQVTEASIRGRMVLKWQGHPQSAERVASSVTNSLRRSAGTNYQALVSYALARFLLEQQSHWYVVHPVPATFAHSLGIRFNAGVSAVDTEGQSDDAEAEDAEGVVVKPDLDILIRNAAWDSRSSGAEPVLLLSVKTSLADRAGSAARWKTYFDLVTQPCEHICEASCAYRRLGIELANDPNVHITHGIVTANIYKMDSDPHFTRWGELRSNQARANTFMFDVRYTTREDSPDVMADGWDSLVEIETWLSETASRFGLVP
jgi:hypothetical protein